jgi:hypothetical protein
MKGPGARGGSRPKAAGVAGGYVSLFEVSYQHAYYNASGGACPDFRTIPTPACQTLMRTLGMVFKDQGTGFSVAINQSGAPKAASYVAARLKGAQGSAAWTWLSFMLVPTNPGFIGLTNLPISVNPLVQNLHLSNLDAKAVGGVLTIGAGAGIGAQSLYPLRGPTVTVATPKGAVASLTDLSGAQVPCQTQQANGQTTFQINRSAYGFYNIVLTRAGKASAPASSFLFLPGQPQSLCLLDLIVAQPSASIGTAADFPLQLPGGQVKPVSLVLQFAARQTFWRYYVVSQGRPGGFTPGLAISGSGSSFTKSNANLPNGDQAVVFTADTALPLRQSSPYAFKLSGQRQGSNGARDDITVARLPTAPPAPVWPDPAGDATSGASEIYVYV